MQHLTTLRHAGEDPTVVFDAPVAVSLSQAQAGVRIQMVDAYCQPWARLTLCREQAARPARDLLALSAGDQHGA